MIDRGFLRVQGRLLHYRHAGPQQRNGDHDALPLLMLHSGPGSSLGLAPLIASLAATRRVLAPDTPGNGDSEGLAAAEPALADYVAVLPPLLDHVGWPRVDIYGQHSGAHIACELALAFPERVRRVVLDGIAVFPDALKAELRERYAQPIVADEFGGHLAQAWHFVSELTLHFPWYRRDPAHRLTAAAVPPPEVRQRLLVELLKAGSTYHLAYHAVFAQDTARRLAALTAPTLLMAVLDDALARWLDDAAAAQPAAEVRRVARDERADCVRGFLDAAV